MFGFISPVVTSFGQSVAGAAVSRSHVRVSGVTMKVSPAMPFMEQPKVLDDASIIGNAGFGKSLRALQAAHVCLL